MGGPPLGSLDFSTSLSSTTRLFSRSFLIGSAAVTLALAAGIAAGAGRGEPVAAGILALGTGLAVVLTYLRSPTRALLLLWLLVVLVAPLSVMAGYDTPLGRKIDQADEVFVLLFAGLTVWHAVRTRARVPRWVALPPACVVVLGLIGAVHHSVPLAVAITGLWLGLKLWTMILATLVLPWKRSDVGAIYRTVTLVGMFVALIGIIDRVSHGAVLAALHLEVAVAPDTRDAASIRSIFFHPNEFSLFMSLLFAITFSRFAIARSRRDFLLSLLFAVSVVLSLRLKGFLSVAAVVAIVSFAQIYLRDRPRNVRPYVVGLLGLVLVIGAYGLESRVVDAQVATFADNVTPRSLLYGAGEEIAADNFPLGAGFGRFASYPSELYYSPLYDQYGLSSVWGLSREFPEFIGDVSWPSVIGETGYLGFACYVIGVIALIVATSRRLRQAPTAIAWVPVAALGVIGVILTDSLGSPALFSWLPAITLALMLGPAMKA